MDKDSKPSPVKKFDFLAGNKLVKVKVEPFDTPNPTVEDCLSADDASLLTQAFTPTPKKAAAKCTLKMDDQNLDPQPKKPKKIVGMPPTTEL